jgi:ABC-type multidrug transport system permease subunit
MRQIWNTTRKDLSRARRDPLTLLMWLAIPLVLGVLLNAVFGGGDVAPQGRLLVADEDNTFVSNLLTGAFSREPLSKMIFVEKVSREQGRTRMDHGGGSALLIIPKGLADAVLRNEPFRLELFTNPSQRILPQMIQQVLSVMVEGEFYLQQVAGVQLRALSRQLPENRTPPDQEIASFSVAVNHLIDSLRKYLIPPVIQLDTAVASENKPGRNFGAIMFPASMFMAMVLLSSALAADIWKELNLGTLRRLAMTQAPLSSFLAGRLLFVVLIFAAVALTGISVARWIANVPVANFAGAVAWLVFSGASFFLLMLLLVLQVSTQRGANVLSNLVVFPLSMLGGSFFPFESMPAWMVSIGSKTPNGLAVVQFKSILDGSLDPRELALAAAALSIAAALAFVLALRKLRRGFAL